MAKAEFPRNTTQRRVILEELQKLSSHPTAPELYEIVRTRLPRISLGTVYRNLERLAALGMIQRVELGASQARFDGNCQPHDHIRCIRCGRVEDLHQPPLVDPSAAKDHDWRGYQLLGHRLEFFGICPECQQSKPCQLDRIDT